MGRARPRTPVSAGRRPVRCRSPACRRSCHRSVTRMGGRPAAGGGRWVDIAPERLPRWLENFARWHGSYTTDGLTVTAADQAIAVFEPQPGAGGVHELADLLLTATEP